jgi:hypothetical protein
MMTVRITVFFISANVHVNALCLCKGCGAKISIKRAPIYEAPTIRILAFEPNAKVKVNTIVPAEAVMELGKGIYLLKIFFCIYMSAVGGKYSPYLENDQRRELARIVADALFLQFPRGQPFQVLSYYLSVCCDSKDACVAGLRAMVADSD